MSIFNSPRLNERSEGFELLNEIKKEKYRTIIVHYSCESFITSHGNTPRITSICLKRLVSGQVKAFSIHLQAQFNGLNFNNLTNTQYDQLELEMLNEFSDFVTTHAQHKWVHWNMRDSNYGFEALNNRIRILGGNQFVIDDSLMYDLPQILGKLFTFGFEKNQPSGRFLNLAERNRISTKSALTGEDEADAFQNKKYLELHMSTLKKVDIMESILHRTINKELKVKTSKRKIYGLSLRGIFNIIKENSWLLLILSLVSFILGAALEPVIQNFFGTSG